MTGDDHEKTLEYCHMMLMRAERRKESSIVVDDAYKDVALWRARLDLALADAQADAIVRMMRNR